MSNALDMSLDDLIKNNKKSGGGNLKGKGRGSTGLGPTRRQTKRSGKRPAPYSGGKALESAWQHDMYSNQMPAYPSPATRVSSIETGSKIYISNLDYGVSNEDIKELFSEFGDLKRYSIHYDRSGRSKGTAEVVFARKVDALAAVKRYNDVQLDGKPMKIEIVGSNMEKPAATTRLSGGGFQSSNRVSRSVQERVGTARSDRRRGGGRGRGKGPKQVSASELDADLEKYHAQISEICVIKLMHPTRDSLAATNLHTPKYWPPHSQGVNYMISDGCGGICLLDARGKPHISKKKSLHFYVLYLWSLNVHYF